MTLRPVPSSPSEIDTVEGVLALCESARGQLAEAQTVTEARHIFAMASTLEHITLVKKMSEGASIAACELAIQAERRIGELLVEEREQGLRAKQGRPALATVENLPAGKVLSTLADDGLSFKEAAELTRLAEAPKERFEAAIASEKERVRSTGGRAIGRTGVLRAIDPEREKRPTERWLEADKFIDACKKVASLRDDATKAVRFGIYPGDGMPLVGSGVRRILGEALAAIRVVQEEMDRRRRDG